MKILIAASIIVLGLSALPTEHLPTDTEVTPVSEQLQWMELEEALEAQSDQPKKIFIDLYTDWCGWCKVMDSKTFTDPALISYMNDTFYVVKMDAEQKEPIFFQGKEFVHVPGRRNGVHQLTLALLDGKASYPAFVILDEQSHRMGYFKGYSKPEGFLDQVKKVLDQSGD